MDNERRSVEECLRAHAELKADMFMAQHESRCLDDDGDAEVVRAALVKLLLEVM